MYVLQFNKQVEECMDQYTGVSHFEALLGPSDKKWYNQRAGCLLYILKKNQASTSLISSLTNLVKVPNWRA